MTILPAIDLKDGRCVRLRQGDMQQETRYSDDPSGMAKHWQGAGAECLHVVDLDGAVAGVPKNIRHIETIVQQLSIPIQVGGGIRSVETVRRYMDIGVARVVIGTAALECPELLAESCEMFPSRVLVGIDVKGDEVAVRGWMDGSGKRPEHVMSSLNQYSLAGIVFTDIARDGMLEGPNLSALEHMAALSSFPLIASGGVTQISDVEAIGRLKGNITGIIIGKALYEGTLELSRAIQAVASGNAKDVQC